MYQLAHADNEDTIIYYDRDGNKYVATGGALAWRINNPGLVRSHSHFAKKNGSIGSCNGYAIFSHPAQGHKALLRWLHSKKYYQSTLKAVAKHYHPNDPTFFIERIAAMIQIATDKKLKSLSKSEFECLALAIEKICGYISSSDESLSLLPRITAKIEYPDTNEEKYLIGDTLLLSKTEATEWILSNRLDGVVVHEYGGHVHLRSRPNHCIWHVRVHESTLPPSEGKLETLLRAVGEKKENQCIWAFINGVGNSKDDALISAGLISKAARGDCILAMQNDSVLWGVKDVGVCVVLKLSVDTQVVQRATQFFRYLLTLSEQDSSHPPVIIFAHSQGAIISEHALELLKKSEREKIRIFTFGGGSFIAQGQCHPDSHNYASAADLVCCLGAPYSRYLALQKYLGRKERLTLEQVIEQMALQDAMLEIDSLNPKAIEGYKKERIKHYEKEFTKINNVTILDPDPDSRWKHEFKSDCYQTTIKSLVKKYQVHE